jgi:hypothetical protein
VKHRFEEGLEPFCVTRHLVELRFVRFVGSSEPQMVWDDAPVAGGDQRRNEVSIEIAPRGVPVHHHDGLAVARAFVDVVELPVG